MQTPAAAPQPANIFSFGRRIGTPFAVTDGVQLTPESLVLLVRVSHLGFVWNWPAAISVSRGGVTERFALPDVTRIAIWTLRLAVVLLALVFVLLARKRQT